MWPIIIQKEWYFTAPGLKHFYNIEKKYSRQNGNATNLIAACALIRSAFGIKRIASCDCTEPVARLSLTVACTHSPQDLTHVDFAWFFSQLSPQRSLAYPFRGVFVLFVFMLHLGSQWCNGAVYFRNIQPEPRAKRVDAVNSHRCRCADAISTGFAVAVHWPQKRNAG